MRKKPTKKLDVRWWQVGEDTARKDMPAYFDEDAEAPRVGMVACLAAGPDHEFNSPDMVNVRICDKCRKSAWYNSERKEHW